jgi:hypothetical protein
MPFDNQTQPAGAPERFSREGEMTTKMPRGAIPTPRSELAASEPYRPEAGAEIFVPSGEFPTPNHELAAAQPYRAGGAAPESFIAWPIGIGFWGNEKVSNSSWAEEAFAKACAEPKVLAPDSVKGTSKNRRFPPPRKSDSRLSCSERGRLAWDSLASSIRRLQAASMRGQGLNDLPRCELEPRSSHHKGIFFEVP